MYNTGVTQRTRKRKGETMAKQQIEICADRVWAGLGTIHNGTIEDCPAVLGADQDASDVAYEAIEDAILDGRDHVTVDGVRYTWYISETED